MQTYRGRACHLPAPFAMHMPWPLRVVQLNPMHAALGARTEDIFHVLKKADILGLCGTQQRALEGFPCAKSRCQGRLAVEAGWSGAPMTNRSAGVPISLGSHFREQDISEVHHGPSELAGRFLAVRLKNCRAALAPPPHCCLLPTLPL